MAALFKRDAKINHGPIIHPRLVGQATTSPLWTSWHAHAFTAGLLSSTCVSPPHSSTQTQWSRNAVTGHALETEDTSYLLRVPYSLRYSRTCF